MKKWVRRISLLLGISSTLTAIHFINSSFSSPVQEADAQIEPPRQEESSDLLRSIQPILDLVQASAANGSTGFLVNEPAICRINFILAGRMKNYTKTFAFNWQEATRHLEPGSCRFDIIDKNHYLLLNMLTSKQQQVVNTVSSKAIVLADYMKLLSLYYLGGITTDLDIEPMVKYPQGWFSPDLGTQDCSVMFGIEHGEWNPENLDQFGYVSPGQILTYIMASQRPGSPFLAYLIQAIDEKVLYNPGFAQIPRIQDIAGSGTVSDTIRRVMDKDYGEQLGSLRNQSTLKQDDSEIVKFSFKGETVCILGRDYLGYNPLRWADLAHHWFQSSWRSDQ